MKKIFTTLWLLFSLHSISQTVHYVNDNATGANNGTSWANAFSKLQDALAKAVSGDQVWVAEGIYYPDEGVVYTNNNRSHSFRLKNGVAIYGGFAGAETNLVERNWNTHLTTLSGDIDQDGTEENNVFHVVVSLSENNSAVLDGFIITKGYAELGSGGEGGIFILASSPTIRHCTISENYSGADGGGILNDANSAPQFINCIISGNGAGFDIFTGEAIGSGGGVFNNNSTAHFINCTISGNSANAFKYYQGTGGGVSNNNSSSQFENCTISGNNANVGGGVYNNGSNSGFNNCNISGNVANEAIFGIPGEGGGIYNRNSPSHFTNSTISGNRADIIGGGVYNDNSFSDFINCIISTNTATLESGGAVANSNCSPRFINCNFVGNSAPKSDVFYNSSASPVITNCIVWGNNLNPINNYNQSNPVITYSIVQGGYAGTGNLDMDPLFVDAANGDLRLKAGSPAIDAGLSSANTTTLDLDGKPRVVNGIIDMGAYEYQVAPMVITSVTANPSTLWPPNHKMKEVKVTTVTTGGSGNTQCHITAVSSNEPKSSKKKGHSSPDWQITGQDKVLLRAERNGIGNGRIYTITVTCSDAAGSSKSKTVQIKVPHDQGHNFITSNAQSNQSETIQVETKGSLKAVPNPFSTQASISYSVPESGYTTLDVIDAAGVRVERLYATQAEAGKVYTLSFGNNKLKSGMYLLRLTTRKHVQTYRLMLMQ